MHTYIHTHMRTSYVDYVTYYIILGCITKVPLESIDCYLSY